MIYPLMIIINLLLLKKKILSEYTKSNFEEIKHFIQENPLLMTFFLLILHLL